MSIHLEGEESSWGTANHGIQGGGGDARWEKVPGGRKCVSQIFREVGQAPILIGI